MQARNFKYIIPTGPIYKIESSLLNTSLLLRIRHADRRCGYISPMPSEPLFEFEVLSGKFACMVAMSERLSGGQIGRMLDDSCQRPAVISPMVSAS